MLKKKHQLRSTNKQQQKRLIKKRLKRQRKLLIDLQMKRKRNENSDKNSWDRNRTI